MRPYSIRFLPRFPCSAVAGHSRLQLVVDHNADLALGDILPQTGTPIGESALDPIILAPDFNPDTSTNQAAVNRYLVFRFAVKMLSVGLASTLAINTAVMAVTAMPRAR